MCVFYMAVRKRELSQVSHVLLMTTSLHMICVTILMANNILSSKYKSINLNLPLLLGTYAASIFFSEIY
jgi:hypothetical protein